MKAPETPPHTHLDFEDSCHLTPLSTGGLRVAMAVPLVSIKTRKGWGPPAVKLISYWSTLTHNQGFPPTQGRCPPSGQWEGCCSLPRKFIQCGLPAKRPAVQVPRQSPSKVPAPTRNQSSDTAKNTSECTGRKSYPQLN